MDIPVWLPDEYAKEFTRTRLQASGYYRAGDSSLVVRLIGVAAATLEGIAARVRRWSRDSNDANAAPHLSAFVRH